MHTTKKSTPARLIAIVLSLLLLLPVVAAAEWVAPVNEPYWPMQAAYKEAVAANDPDAICETSEAIISYYSHLSTAEACSRAIPPILKAVKIYESTGRYDDALRLYQMYKKANQGLERFTGTLTEKPSKRPMSFRIRQRFPLRDSRQVCTP